MKPAVLNNIERTGNLHGESVAMTVDANSIEHIMSLLTDLYSDPELAVIREYSTNALDSHVEAGNSAPIEVYTPGPLNPNFRVKDYGVGMDSETIRNVYSKYGASTKRNTDAQVGMLGLGCKSALTYAPQFTVTGVKDGIKTIVAISRDEKGRGVMEIISITKTNDPNSVEINIPVAGQRNSFAEKAKKFFSFWKSGTVLLNGEEPNLPELTRLSENLYLSPDNSFGDYLVMGNVAYPVKEGMLTNGNYYYRHYSVVAFIEIGEANFVPSREELHYTAKTNATIERVKTDVAAGMREAAQAEINNAKTGTAAVDSYVKWNKMMSRRLGRMYWNSSEIETEYRGVNLWTYSINPGRNSTSHVNDISYDCVKNAVLRVVDFFNEDLCPADKSKIRSYINGHNIEHGSVIVTGVLPGAPFTDDFETVSFKEILKYKPIRNKSVPGQKTISVNWPTVTKYGHVVRKTVLDPTKTIYWIERNRRNDFGKILNLLGDNAQLVAVPTNRVNSFNKQYPAAINLKVWLTTRTQDALDKLEPSDYAKMSLSDHDIKILNKIDASKIKDQRIVTAASVARGVEYSAAYKAFMAANDWLDKLDFGRLKIDREDKSVFNEKDYPMLAAISWWQMDGLKGHAELYINAVFDSTKGSN
jgi:Histidine kinase-, DNA gyrase B-, and HSP90-like ATPase